MAGTPTKAEVETMLKAVVDILEQNRAHGAGLVGTGQEYDVLEQSVEGDFAPTGLTTFAADNRKLVSDSASSGQAAVALEPIIREYARLAGSRFWNGDINAALRDVWLYWVAQSDTVTERNLTYGTPSANGSNTGDGTLQRITIDAWGFNREAVHGELRTCECVVDQNSPGGKRHKESFRLYGADAGLDALDVGASGGSVTIPSRHAGTDLGSGSMLKNSSFQTFDSGETTAKFSGWTLDANYANADQDTTDNAANFYRSFPGDAATNAGAHSLKLSGAVVATQKLSVRNVKMTRGQPYYFGVMYNRATGSGAMTLRLRLGSQTVTVVLSAQTGWNELKLPLDTNSWLANFNEDELDLTIEAESYTSGYVLVDDAILAPMTPFDGTFWFLRGGATPFMAANSSLPLGDVFTMTDSGGAASAAKIQYWWWRGTGGYLPHTSGSATVADP